ncbi:hypothetical protein GCM10009104_13270 [Marinobacterium maritimum]|uniref:Medium/long-chain acyl-CoA thioesterase YigI n=1 Tax=Marinobacterium maritimum TaxID=500162 RepID=A0ABN1I4K3_9GAMM
MSTMNTHTLEMVRPNGLRDSLGFIVSAWSDGQAELRVEVDQRHLNLNGYVHGGVFMSLLDSAAGLCGTYCGMPGRVRRCITVAMNTQFINPVEAGELVVVAKLVSRGRKIFFAEARITCGDKLIATAQGTLRYIRGGEDVNGVTLK